MNSSEKFCLQWNEFKDNIKTAYRDFRKAADFSDVTLVSEDGHQIQGHRVILSSSCLFFRQVLHTTVHTHPLVYMRGVHYTHLSNIVDFIYKGEVEVRKDDLEAFLEIAGELSVMGMTKSVGKEDYKPLNNEYDMDTMKSDYKNDWNLIDRIEETLNEENKSKEAPATNSDARITLDGEEFSNNTKDAQMLTERKMKEGGLLGQNMELEEKIDSMVERRNGTWICVQCEKSSRDRFNIKRHAETHLVGFVHNCPDCGS